MASQNLTVPYRKVITGGVKPGKSFIIRGVIGQNADRIAVNLRYTYGVAFHYNPRFDANNVVCNSWDGKWGPEEYPKEMPFKQGQPFEIYIFCADKEYRVCVNGQQVCAFKHRFLQFDQIDVLEVVGSLQLNYVDA